MKCRRRKEAFRGENALEKGRTVMVRKIIADNGKKTKRGRKYMIFGKYINKYYLKRMRPF